MFLIISLDPYPTGNDVLPDHTDVVVTVVAGLLVVEAQSVEQLVLDGVVVQAAGTAQRHGLSVTSTTNVGVTSRGVGWKRHVKLTKG